MQYLALLFILIPAVSLHGMEEAPRQQVHTDPFGNYCVIKVLPTGKNRVSYFAANGLPRSSMEYYPGELSYMDGSLFGTQGYARYTLYHPNGSQSPASN